MVRASVTQVGGAGVRRSETFTYDSNGFLDSARNALNEVTRFTVDKSGRLLKTTRADAREVGLEQDRVGNLLSVTPPDAGTHRFVYNKANQKETYSPPAVAGVSDEKTTYDLDGLVTTAGHSDATGTVVTREPSGRVRQVTTPWWVNDLTYTTSSGQLATLTRGAQKLEWTYDGFLMKEEKASGVAPGTSQWRYDSDFRVAAHTLGGTAVAFGYDGDSLLTSAGAATLTRLPATGQLASLVVGSITTNFTHNTYGELASVATRAGGTGLYSEGLSYDAAGRLRLMEEVVEGVPVQWVYGYDVLGRLTSASKNGASPTTWSYDGNGNRLTEAGVGATYDAQDRLLTQGSTTYSWDGLGGRRTRTEGASVTRYVHDGLGALHSVTLPDGTVVAYEYDGRQRRVAKLRNGTVVKRWIYDGQYRVAAEVDALGVITSRFIYGSQGHSPDYVVQGGVTYAYVKSHLGSVKLVVNAATGAVVQRLDYDAWGNVMSDSAPGFQSFAFAGGVYDADTKLTHFGCRDYDASAGVWTSKDPIRLSGGLNQYAYAANDPIEYVDRDGLRVELMNQAAFDLAGQAANNPQALAVLEWLDSSADTYQVWGDQALEPGTGGQWFPGELAGKQQTSRRGGTIRVDNKHCEAGGKSPAGALGHELTHAGLRDAQVNPWSDPSRPPVPLPVKSLGRDALPGGGLPGDHGDATSPHGALEWYWNVTFGDAR